MLSNTQVQSLSPEELEEYEGLDVLGKEQFEYFFGFTTHTEKAIIVQNKEVLEYQKAAANIQLKTIATMLQFTPHAGQQPLFFSFDAQQELYNNFVLLFGRRAQPLDSTIHTPTGTITMGDAKVGTTICDPEGGTQTITEVHSIYDGDVYDVTLGYGKDKTNGSRTIRCDAHHLFSVIDHHGNTRTLSVEELLPIYTTTRSKSHVGAAGVSYAFKIPNPEPLEYMGKQLPLDPYALGLLLGDGAIGSYRLGMQDKVAVTYMRDINMKFGGRGMVLEDNGYYTTSFAMLRPIIDDLGLTGTHSDTKFIPKEYLTSSIQQRLSLLQGLMDTDGTVSNKGKSLEYTTVSNDLHQGVKDIILSLGGSVKVTTRITKYTYNGIVKEGKLSYRLTFNLNLQPFRLIRKASLYTPRRMNNFIIDITPTSKEPVRCITVSSEHKTYISDDLVVTHNTGKSEVTSVVATRELFLPHSSTVLLTPVFENAKIIFGNVLKKVEQLGLPVKSINRGSFRLELETGARFSANSAANVEAALGSSNSLIIVDETQSIPDIKRIMNQLLVPTMLDYGIRKSGILWAHQILLGTPRGEENELTDYYYNELTLANWKSFTAPSHSNPTLPTAYLNDMRLELGDLLFRQEILAEIIGSDENVFHAFNRNTNLYSDEALPPLDERRDGWTARNYFTPNKDSLYIAGLDIGWSDSTANVHIYRTPEGRYYVHAAYSKNNTTTSQHVKNYKEIEDKLPGECDIRYCDPAAAQTINDYIVDYDYDVIPAKNDIAASIKYINNLLSPTGVNQEPRLYIHESLGELIRQVSRIRYKKVISKKSSDPFIKDPDGTHWDLIAALRYAIFSDQYNIASLNILR